MPLQPGAKLGPYEIESQVGAGGMGEVYKANDTRLGRTVAIKVLPPHLSQNPDLRQRFEREAKAISSIQHPHICSLFDVGQENGTDYLVMEFLEGETLAERLERGPIPQEQMLRLGIQIADALDKAHRQGIVHRDLKPGNVVLTKSGAKLLDFGLAAVRAQANAPLGVTMTAFTSGGPPGSEPLTAQGTILGTFQYMAPEQLEGQEADTRTDIFALGLVLYEMATGKKAFEGKSQASLIASILSSEPQPIGAHVPMTPPALERVVKTCLAKDPELRWQTAHDVALQLQWILEGGSEAGIPAPVAARRKTREQIAWAAAAVATVAAVALAVAFFTRPQPAESDPIRFQIAAPANLSNVGSARISPNGRYLAYQGTDSTGKTLLWVRPLNSLTDYPLPGTEAAGRPFWSPDSRFLAFFAGPKLKKVPVTGGPPQTICDAPGGVDGTWGRSGVILFDGSSADSIQRVNASGGVPTAATVIRRDEGEAYHAWPQFLPDGEHFLFLAYGAMSDDNKVMVGRLDGDETEELMRGRTRLDYASPGHLLYVQDGTLLAQPFDPGSRKVAGDPFPVVEDVGSIGSGLAHFGVSENGVLIYQRGIAQRSRPAWYDRGGRRLAFVGAQADYANPDVSPDGNRIAVEIDDERSGSTDIWVLDATRGTSSRFTFDDSDETDPSWSPDGSRIVFASDRTGPPNLYVKPASGAGSAEAVMAATEAQIPIAWSADGARLTYHTQNQGTSWDVFVYETAGSNEAPAGVQSQFMDIQGRLSPDGRWMAYTSNENGRFEVYVRAFPGPGGKWQISTEGGSEPFWRADGKELYFLSLNRELMAVDMSTGSGLEAGVPRRLFNAPVRPSAFTRNRYCADPSGERFLVLELEEQQSLPPITVVVNWLSALRGDEAP